MPGLLTALCVLLTVVYVGERYRTLFDRLVSLRETKAQAIDAMPLDIERNLRLFGADWAVDDMRAKALEVYAESHDWARVRAWLADQQKAFT